MTTISPTAKLQFFDANGDPLVDAKLYTYAAGTNTPLATYTDAGGGTANANPVRTNARGECDVWLGTSLYKFVLYTSTDTLIWTVDNIGGAVTVASLAASNGSSLIGFIQAGSGAVARTALSKMRDVLTPYDFGATGGANDTVAIQAMLDAAIAQGKVCDFLGVPWNVGSLLFGTGARARNINLKAIASSTDVTPVTISTQSDIQLHILKIDGNRVQQSSLATSGGDGQRYGIGIFGRCSNISIDVDLVTNCATDGIAVWSNGTTPADDSDYLFENISIRCREASWNGRHGVFTMSENGVTLHIDQSTSNGQDMPGYPVAPYSSGGNARRTPSDLAGTRYGRPYTHEGQGVGEGFDGLTVIGGNWRNNAGGVLIYEAGQDPSVVGFVTRKNLKLSVGYVDAPDFAAGGYPFNINQLISYVGTGKTFENIEVDGNFDQNSVSFVGVSRLHISGNVEPGASLVNAVYTNCDFIGHSLNGDGAPFFLTPTSPVLIVGTSQIVGTGWVLSAESMTPIKLYPDGSIRFLYSVTVTPDAAEVGLFRTEFTTGWRIIEISPSPVYDTGTGSFVSGGVKRTGSGNNFIEYGFTSITTNGHTLSAYIDMRKPNL